MLKRSGCLCLSLLILMMTAGCSASALPTDSDLNSTHSSSDSKSAPDNSMNRSSDSSSASSSLPFSSDTAKSSRDAASSPDRNSGNSSIDASIPRISAEAQAAINKYTQPYTAKINAATGYDEALTGKNVFFTFDDGPSSNNTPRVLAILKKYNIKATFFVCGPDSPEQRRLIRQEFDDGHAIGIHGYSHALYSLYKSEDSYWDDFTRLEWLIHEITNVWPTLYRFPGGTNNEYIKRALSEKIRVHLAEQGFYYYDWNVSSNDSNAPPAEVIVKTVLKNFRSGMNSKKPSIILLHDSSGRPTSADALEPIIVELIKMGCIFGPLNHTVMPIQFKK